MKQSLLLLVLGPRSEKELQPSELAGGWKGRGRTPRGKRTVKLRRHSRPRVGEATDAGKLSRGAKATHGMLPTNLTYT